MPTRRCGVGARRPIRVRAPYLPPRVRLQHQLRRHPAVERHGAHASKTEHAQAISLLKYCRGGWHLEADWHIDEWPTPRQAAVVALRSPPCLAPGSALGLTRGPPGD